jgi:maltose alpha-D-glucosyltransferase/alpha-amylase
MAPRFIAAQRWFAGGGIPPRRTELVDEAVLPNRAGASSFLLPLVRVELRNGERQDYSMPLAIEERGEPEELLPYAVARVRRGPRIGLLYGAGSSADFALSFIQAMRSGAAIPSRAGGQVVFRSTAALAEYADVSPGEVKRLSAEQSNTSIAIGEHMLLKLYRRLQSGQHPEVEVARFLTEVAGFANTPPLLGTVEYIGPNGSPTALAILQRFLRNQGDAWAWLLNLLKRELDTIALIPPQEEIQVEEAFATLLQTVRTLGRRTAELHIAFATPTNDPAFALEAMTTDDVRAAAEDARKQG